MIVAVEQELLRQLGKSYAAVEKRKPVMDLKGLFRSWNTDQEYTVTDKAGISNIGSNRVLGDTALLDDADKLSITFKGSGNILYLEKGIKHLKRLELTFTGDNSLVYISKSRHEYILRIEAESDTVCFFGPQLFTSKTKAMTASIRHGDFLLIGADCMLSLGIEIDTMNPDGSGYGDIIIGDHVWIGQGVKIYGDSTIGSRAVIGAQTVVDGSECRGRACWVTRRGELTKLIDNIVFTKDSMRAVPTDLLERFDVIDEDIKRKILEIKGADLKALAVRLRHTESASNRLKYIRKLDPGSVPDRSPLMGDLVLQREETGAAAENESSSGNGEEAGAAAHNESGSGNRIIGSFDETAGNSVEFSGKGNILFVEPGAKPENCRVIFKYDNSLVYLSKSDKPYSLMLYMHYDTTAYVGSNVRTPEKVIPRAIVSEAKSVVIGDDVRFGRRVWMRTSDQHPIYDIESGRRINKAGNISIGAGANIASGKLVRKGSAVTGVNEEEDIRLKNLADAVADEINIEKRLDIIKEYKNQVDKTDK